MINGGVRLLRVAWTDAVTPSEGRIIGADSKDSFLDTDDAMLDEVTRFSQLVDGGRLLERPTTAPLADESLERMAREMTPTARS